jgi:hypothetical protein
MPDKPEPQPVTPVMQPRKLQDDVNVTRRKHLTAKDAARRAVRGPALHESPKDAA